VTGDTSPKDEKKQPVKATGGEKKAVEAPTHELHHGADVVVGKEKPKEEEKRIEVHLRFNNAKSDVEYVGRVEETKIIEKAPRDLKGKGENKKKSSSKGEEDKKPKETQKLGNEKGQQTGKGAVELHSNQASADENENSPGDEEEEERAEEAPTKVMSKPIINAAEDASPGDEEEEERVEEAPTKVMSKPFRTTHINAAEGASRKPRHMGITDVYQQFKEQKAKMRRGHISDETNWTSMDDDEEDEDTVDGDSLLQTHDGSLEDQDEVDEDDIYGDDRLDGASQMAGAMANQDEQEDEDEGEQQEDSNDENNDDAGDED